MATTHGTSHFISAAAAERYYEEHMPASKKSKQYYVTLIQDKIEAGEISIGPPSIIGHNQTLSVSNEGRYVITTEEM